MESPRNQIIPSPKSHRIQPECKPSNLISSAKRSLSAVIALEVLKSPTQICRNSDRDIYAAQSTGRFPDCRVINVVCTNQRAGADDEGWEQISLWKRSGSYEGHLCGCGWTRWTDKGGPRLRGRLRGFQWNKHRELSDEADEHWETQLSDTVLQIQLLVAVILQFLISEFSIQRLK